MDKNFNAATQAASVIETYAYMLINIAVMDKMSQILTDLTMINKERGKNDKAILYK